MRRMKQYMLALGLALAGEARAEKPKECIEKLHLAVEIKPSAQIEGLQEQIDKILTPVRSFYQRQVSLPVTWSYEPSTLGNIVLKFGDYNDCAQEWSLNVEDIEMFIGLADRERKSVYMFHTYALSRWPPQMHYGSTIAHELGHLLGLEHSDVITTREGKGNIMVPGFKTFLRDSIFLDEDKQKIQSQMCQPTEQQ